MAEWQKQETVNLPSSEFLGSSPFTLTIFKREYGGIGYTLPSEGRTLRKQLAGSTPVTRTKYLALKMQELNFCRTNAIKK